ncbi:uncharacterized protein UHO2_00339 [Ustilago hordei]|uniref:uncharacterized protein n=1 Tax=Ustilago hordei TaxID=120017 RepID=UPI001A5D23C3|nr:uncharacterized protein UHO2_00339 [Ustilago hordei]SYW81834.1 related to retrotransposon protein [Ustilago hordei]
MMDENLHNKLERLLSLMEAQLEPTRQGQCEERSGRRGRIHDWRPANANSSITTKSNVNYKKYASPTGPRYVKPRVDLYNRSRTDPYGLEQEDNASAMGDPNSSQSKPIATPFPKFNPRDVEIFILEAEAWFKFNQIYEQTHMINHMGAQLEGNAHKWWTSKLHIDRAWEGRLFNDWHYFTEHLSEQFNP